MAKYTLQLPTLQNWDCHNCGGCCTQHGIYITEEEKQRIIEQNWQPEDGIPAEQPIFVKMGGPFSKRWHRLAHQPNGGCVFLDERGLCRIHAKFGEPAKPLACRIYPYTFHPAGNKVTVSLRFSCPSVAENLGAPVTANRKTLKEIASLVVPENVTEAKPPALNDRTSLNWQDTLRIVDALDQTFAAEATVRVKLLRSLFWLDLIDQTRFEKISGPRLGELLDMLTEAAEGEVADVASGEEPSKMGQMQFRLLAGQYARKDTYTSSDQSLAGRFRMLKYALRLTYGTGTLPPLNEQLKELPFSALERSFGPLPERAEEMLSRYFRVKIQGLHFCGAAYYKIPLVEGFYSLALVYPTVLWIARWIAASAGRDVWEYQDLLLALTIADHQHGYSPALGTWGFRNRARILRKMGDITKLIDKYS